MKKKLQILVALAAGVAAIAIGQRTQNNDTKQRDTRTQKAQVEGVDDAEHWFV
jgi:hypothetical protein